MKHKLTAKTGVSDNEYVTWYKCKCGWKTTKLRLGWEHTSSALSEQIMNHLIKVKVIILS